MPSFAKKISLLRYGIGAKFLARIFAVSLVVISCLSAAHLYIGYKKSMFELNIQLLKIQDSYVEVVSSYAWVANTDMLQKQINGIAKLPNIQFVELRIFDLPIMTAGVSKPLYYLSQTFPLTQHYRGKNIDLGSLQVNISLDNLKYSLFHELAQIVSVQMITIFIISALIFHLFHSLVGKHLKTITQYTKALSLQKLATPLVLHRPKINDHNQDELAILEHSINQMRKNLITDMQQRELAEKQLKESEERYSCLFENNYSIMLLLDPATLSIIDANPAACTFYGYSRAEITRMKITDINILPAEHLETDIKSIQTKQRQHFFFQHRLASGEIREIEAFSIPIIINGKELLFSTINDITNRLIIEREKKNLEIQLRQTHKMEAIGTMAGGIAHDFNNILTAVIGYTEIALEDIPASSPAKHEIEQVLKAGNRAKELVRQILTFSRMAGLTQSHVDFNISPVLKEVLKLQRSIIPTTIDIIINIDEDCGQIHGDPTQIHQIIMNLCSNASHAMEEKGGSLQVTLRKTVISEEELKTKQNLHAGTYIQLTVSDTGIGITQELIEKIFDPYFSTKEVGKGTGMGLAIVQSIVKNHGGFVSVYSIPGQGSTFNVFFPRIQNKIADNQIDEAYEIPRGTEKILFVDDENMVTEVGKSMLERLGYSVTATENSAEALKLFQSDPSSFDLVITDQTMPNIQGSDLAIQLLQIRPDIPIILCTGYSSLIDEAKAQEIGIKGYAMKPVDLKIIARLIRNLLDNNQSPS